MVALRDQLGLVFLMFFIGLSTLIYLQFGIFDFFVTGAISAVFTLLVCLRSLMLILPHYRRQKAIEEADAIRVEVEKRRSQVREFGRACGEICRMMSQLSDADLSIFVTADQMPPDDKERFRFVTSRGSPNHHVLVAMTDVGAARPVEMKKLVEGADFTQATYELTPLGRHILAKFIRDALHMRR